MLFERLFEDDSIIRQAIQEHIDSEVLKSNAERDAKIQQLEATIEQQDNAIMELTTIVATMGGAN